ncbi:MAG: hydantoin utilization protein [Solibacterales bacterium]|nr:hydantoin utilization protein [Bryobacterales bacterium]|tara:strand:+ start:2456 stop:4522 length:2067 start_codon:yes stop_codon:yes gene_type:complete
MSNLNHSQRIRCGIDTGGTFTDLVGLNEESGELVIAKWPSSPSEPEKALTGVIKDSKLAARDFASLVLGTTVATNAMIQRAGARVLFVTTKGFGDVPFIQRVNRKYHYSFEWKKPEPLVKREDCFEIDERVNYQGRVLTPLKDSSLNDLVEMVTERLENAESEDVVIAVCLLFSHLNPEHENLIKRHLETNFPSIPVSLSHQVAPIWREYERGSTTIADAYVKPVLQSYVQGVRESLDHLKLDCPWALMKSNGGHSSPARAEEEPVNMVLSGLSGGIIGGRYFGELAGWKDLVTLDMGGTSCDVGVIRDGKISYNTDYQIEWSIPIAAPFVDLTTIGAGGGSIAWIDKGGFLRVGPQSAGADPGPVCYGNGGEEVTVTDANLVLGRLNPDYFLAGKMRLTLEKATEKITELGRQMNMDTPQTAQAIVEMANENMANAIRVVSIDRGLDARDFTLVAFGGAGPLHAVGIVERVGMKRIVLPPHPGLCSAFGGLIADYQVDKIWSQYFRSDNVDWHTVRDEFDRLVQTALQELSDEGFSGKPEIEKTISMRYAGQNYEHDVRVADGGISETSLQNALAEFHRVHEHFYGYSIGHEVIELIKFSVKAIGRIPKPQLKPLTLEGNAKPIESRPVYFKEQGFLDCPVYRRSDLPSGFEETGPALIEEEDSMTLVHPENRIQVNEYGVITIEVN